MAAIQFLRGNDVPVVSVKAEGSSAVQREIMSKDVFALAFTSPTEVGLQVNDYVMLGSTKYKLNQLNPAKKLSKRSFSYNLTLEGPMYDLGMCEFFSLGDDNTLREPEFAVMGTLLVHAQLIIRNLNRIYPGVWSLGTVLDTDTLNISYSQDNCLSALGKMAKEFDLEYYFDGYVLSIYKRQANSGVTLQYGRGKGLYSIERVNKDSSNIVTRLYAFGGSTNVPANYRNGSSKLLLPDGFYIERNVDVYGVIEGTQVFDDIYPKRIGTVTAIDNDDIYAFFDNLIDFDVNVQAIAGTTVKVVFNTGQLAGYKFDINTFDTLTKKFRINKNTDEKAIDVPSEAMRPAVGDQYVLEDLNMPLSDIYAGEAALLDKANDYMDDNSTPRMQYNVECDPLYFRDNAVSIALGNNVHIVDADLGIDRQIRVNAISVSLVYPYAVTLTLSDVTTQQILTRVIAEQNRAAAIIKINRLSDVNRARRNWRDTQELEGMVFDTEGHYYTDKIKPLSIETTLLAVGARSQQFTLNGIVFSPNKDGSASKFSSTAGQLVNLSLEDQPITWNIDALNLTGLADGTAYYIYAKCQKAGNAGAILLSTDQITFDQDATYYHFLIGVLHSAIDGVRGLSQTYGQTNINGKFVNTGVVRSFDGITYFDLDAGVIGGRIVFAPGSSGYDNLSDKPDLSGFAVQSYVDAVLAGMQSQIDGEITSWYYDYEPTLSNVPASDWADAATKHKHEGDLFFWKSKNYAYRFLYDAGADSFSWVLLQDTDITLALANAAAAQDTADGKRRVFVAEPTTPYDKGDLWSQGASGDLMACRLSRLSGAYNATDWEPASKYTDDTAANAAQDAANTAQTAADTAQTAADTAQTAANTAQASANAAQTSANSAQADATTANNKLADIANDNLLTVSEKPAVLKEWQIIQGENPVIDAQAATYSLDTSAYDLAFNDLGTYVTGLLANMTTDSVIVGADFRVAFANYYNEKVALLKLISDAAKLAADDAQSAADTAQTAADAAQASADTANAAASAAQDAADTAQANAENALATATRAADVTDYLFTTVDGNLIATGTVLVGDAIHNNAGISGVTDAGDNSVRFWAGTAYADRADAPFRVTEAGAVVMTQADITGTITATAGKIGNWNISEYGLEIDAAEDGRVQLRKSLPLGAAGGAGEVFAGIGSNIEFDGSVAVFGINRNEPGLGNYALTVRALGSEVENMAIQSAGDCEFAYTGPNNYLSFKLKYLPHTGTMAGFGAVVARNDDGMLFILNS